MYQLTTATEKIAALTKRIRGVQGGTSASKTVSIIILLIQWAQEDLIKTLTSVVSESFPHLKRGSMRDFELIMDAHNYFQPAHWNKTNATYSFETGSKLEFFSADQPGKVRGPRRDRLFLNEANNMPFQTFEQLEVRTKEFIILDWNPVTEFWFYDKVLGARDDVDHLILTYRDNEALSEEIVKSIEQRKNRKNWWLVYGEGQLGEIEGKIYTGWKIIDEVPEEAKLMRRGLDFGYTNDFTSCCDIYKWNGGYVIDENFHRKGMSNKAIADELKLCEGNVLTVADNAEPKSIDEIKDHGIPIKPCVKGPDSVRWGIGVVQDQVMYVTKRSLNIIKAERNYIWATDKNGEIISPNVPEHEWSDAMDPVRYGITSMFVQKQDRRTSEQIDQVRREKAMARSDAGV